MVVATKRSSFDTVVAPPGNGARVRSNYVPRMQSVGSKCYCFFAHLSMIKTHESVESNIVIKQVPETLVWCLSIKAIAIT
jgi:hypothetical protein